MTDPSVISESSSDASVDTYDTARTFESLGIAMPLCKALADDGITTAFPIQAMTIADALAGRDVCGKAKTGSGKTLGFGLPMLQRIAEGLTGPDGSLTQLSGSPASPKGLVLLPTRELAVQVHDVLAPLAEALGMRVVAVYGGADIERQIAKLRKGCELIIATPGRLIDLGDRGELKVDDLDVLVLDEADRMADMGFMPQVEWVLRRLTEPHQTLLFSATLDGEAGRIAELYTRNAVRHEHTPPAQKAADRAATEKAAKEAADRATAEKVTPQPVPLPLPLTLTLTRLRRTRPRRRPPTGPPRRRSHPNPYPYLYP